MDLYDEEILNVWRSLNRHAVRYILVGGFAVNLHRYFRTTDDMDLYVEDTLQNRENLGAALQSLGIASREMIMRMQFIPGWSVMHLPGGFALDIMTNVKGLEQYSFEECLTLASIAQIEDVAVKFLHFNHLVQSKKAANRPKDQIDVLALEEIKRIEQSGN